ncbi:MAG: 4Fe-4S dicluster domain-containing protein [Planctomycetaceae bacterium]
MTDAAQPIYWKSLSVLNGANGRTGLQQQPGRRPEPAAGMSRRHFLEVAGFSLSLSTFVGCGRAPVAIALPLVEQPEGTIPGRALHFATTCGGCTAGCGLLATVRDGRPLKMEGLPEHPGSRGGLCAVGQAQTIGLYDSLRFTQPLVGQQQSDWETIDKQIIAALEKLRSGGGAVRLVTGTVTSPTLKAAIDAFLGSFADARHVVWDAVSSSAILDAHAKTQGVRVLPQYRFDQAEVIVSLGADFLGTWISPVEFTAGWRTRRSPTPEHPEMSWHAQLEGRMSLSGCKADRRIRVSPHNYGAVLSRLYVDLSARAGTPVDSAESQQHVLADPTHEELADRLWNARGSALVISDSQDVRVQVLVNGINHLLQGYGATLNVERPSFQKQGSDAALLQLLEELKSGSVQALFVCGVDPIHSLPDAKGLTEAIGKVPLVVSTAEREDDFSVLAGYVCPDHHPLESWLDAEPVDGQLSLSQPLLQPLGQTRSLLESLAAWTGTPATAQEILQRHWREQILPRAEAQEFQQFWDRSLHDGVVTVPPNGVAVGEFQSSAVDLLPAEEEGWGLELFSRVGLPCSRHAHNPWLQELPDPITKTTWDNFVALSPKAAAELGVTDGDLVRVSLPDNGDAVELPAVVQPGQHDRVVAIPLGYGVRGTDRFSHIGPRWLEARPTVARGERIGKNAAPLLALESDSVRYFRSGVKVTATGRHYDLATTQEHHSLEVPPRVAPHGAGMREPIQETTLPQFAADPSAGTPQHHEFGPDLWPDDHPRTGHAWGMVIDLNACTGCSACVIACQAENNVPVVGRDEVLRQREMHWIRLDRYYSGDGDDVDVAHQPMMCQHCGNAPCETVCPVLATVHSDEGLNDQAYNRCVGTRYCANNCPYKVRRFNWFDYPHEDSLQNLVLNPDVTVRARGVMEKCSMCVQRIEEGKAEASRLGMPVADGSIRTACQQSCPAQAIVFGDMNDSESAVSQAAAGPGRFGVLEEFNFRPAVSYLRTVRNRADAETDSHSGEESDSCLALLLTSSSADLRRKISRRRDE